MSKRLAKVLELSMDTDELPWFDNASAAAMDRKFGVTVEQYMDMYADQAKGCAICGCKCKTGKRLLVDHDHKTGRVRGLLCSKCNTALGQMNDDITLLAKAIQYLSK